MFLLITIRLGSLRSCARSTSHCFSIRSSIYISLEKKSCYQSFVAVVRVFFFVQLVYEHALRLQDTLRALVIALNVCDFFCNTFGA